MNRKQSKWWIDEVKLYQLRKKHGKSTLISVIREHTKNIKVNKKKQKTKHKLKNKKQGDDKIFQNSHK